MPEHTLDTYVVRARLREDLRQALMEGMKKAEAERNWPLFNRYMQLYLRMHNG